MTTRLDEMERRLRVLGASWVITHRDEYDGLRALVAVARAASFVAEDHVGLHSDEFEARWHTLREALAPLLAEVDRG